MNYLLIIKDNYTKNLNNYNKNSFIYYKINQNKYIK